MKVNPKQSISRWKTGFFHVFLTIFLMVTVACDFDIPEKFEMPTWYFDLKIPLVQTKYQMTDISNDTAGIFLTDDSLGFEIIQEGEMPATELPALPPIPLDLNEEIASPEIPGIEVDIELPVLAIKEKINVVAYDVSIYQDTAKLCEWITAYDTTVFPPEPFDTLICLIDSTTGDTIGKPFSFPTDSVRHMTAENYNTFVVALFDSVMGLLSTVLDTTINLGLSSLPLPADPPIISSVDRLLIGGDETNSLYSTRFKNNTVTNLENVYSFMVTGDRELDIGSYGDPNRRDSLASHNEMPTIAYGEEYDATTPLAGAGLRSFLKLATNMSMAPATDIVTIPPGSLYVDFKLAFQMSTIDSMEVTTNQYSLSDGLEIPAMELPEMDMSESGISKMEIYRNILKSNAPQSENRFIISDLQSSFPFPLDFVLQFKNFIDPTGSDSVYVKRTLTNRDSPYTKITDMRGWYLQSTERDNNGDGWPDSAFNSFDFVLDIAVPETTTTIPLDGSPLGSFAMRMVLDQLSFESIGANLYMEMPAEPTQQEFPPGLSGAIPTEALIELIFKNQIRLPIEMNMEFKGTNSLGEIVYMPVIVDTIGFPLTSASTDTAMTIIGLSKLGTSITIYESVDDSLPSFQKINTPCDTCASIIDLLASNPVELVITPEVKVDGRGSIESGKAIRGGFRVTIPFVLQLEPMTFMGGTATAIEEFDHDTRYKIRNSLLETELVSNITNALPFGAEVSILLSNDSLFPTDTSWKQLGIFRDSLASRGILQQTDSLYIIRKCEDISPDSGRVYIFNVLTDYSECFDGLPYIVKYNASGTDTIISYVDTLFKFMLPDPEAYYSADDTTGYPEGMVAVPGSGVYASTIDTSQIYLLTDYGNHYTMPRFYLPGTDSRGVFLSVEDYLEISSFITFRLSSSGAFGGVNPELIITYPNGGQTLYTDQTYEILWAIGGSSSEKVDLYYSIAGDSATYKSANCLLTDNWTSIALDLDNLGSYSWDLSTTGLAETDSLRLKIVTSNGSACDLNGHYIKIRNSTQSNRFMRSKNPKLGLRLNR